MIDPKTQALIIKYLRKAWLYSPSRRAVIRAAESGAKSKEGEKLYCCVVGSHKVQKIYVDHLVPMVPLSGFDSWDALLTRLFDENNMRAICKLHHAAKTKLENLERKRVKKNGKQTKSPRI